MTRFNQRDEGTKAKIVVMQDNPSRTRKAGDTVFGTILLAQGKVLVLPDDMLVLLEFTLDGKIVSDEFPGTAILKRCNDDEDN